jgi:hypothetical protein
MKRYGNRAGNSGVVAYACGPDRIDVRFRNGWIYTYTAASASPAIVERMAELAEAGAGLSTYISTTVKGRYAAKRRGP